MAKMFAVQILQPREEHEEIKAEGVRFVLPGSQEVSVSVDSNGNLEVRSTTGRLYVAPISSNDITIMSGRF